MVVFIGGRETTALEEHAGDREGLGQHGTAKDAVVLSLGDSRVHSSIACLRIVDIRTISFYIRLFERRIGACAPVHVHRRAEARGNSSPSMGSASLRALPIRCATKERFKTIRADRRRVAMDAASFSKDGRKPGPGESRVFRKDVT